MKEVSILLTELSKEETLQVKDQQILIYDPWLKTFKIERNNHRNFIGKNKNARNDLVYFSFLEMNNQKNKE